MKSFVWPLATLLTLLFIAMPAGAQSIPAASLTPAWPASEAAHLSPRDAQLLTLARATLEGNLISGRAWAPYRGVMPALGNYRGIWNWDSAFHAVGISHWDTALARDQIRILFDKQLPSGALPDVIWENGTMVTDFTKPPVMAWAVAVVDHRHPEAPRRDEFLRDLYPKLVKLTAFWERERGGNSDGLFFYAGTDPGDESGWDDSIRWDTGYKTAKDDSKRLWAIDLNCYMVSNYRAIAYIAGRLALPEDEAKWAGKAQELADRINARLWDDKLGFYIDRDRTSGKPGPALSPAGFMPLFVHIAPPDRAKRVALLAADAKKFFPGMPTAAYDTPGYRSGAYWRGPFWLNASYFALKGLRDSGSPELASQMRETLLNWIAADKTALWEYYDSRSGKGAGAKTFGWSAVFTEEFVLDWDNDAVTWLF